MTVVDILHCTQAQVFGRFNGWKVGKIPKDMER